MSKSNVVQVMHRWPVTIGGVSVPASRDGATTETATFYIDAASAVLRGVDERDQDARGATVATGTLRVIAYEVVPAAEAPAGLFTYTPPPGVPVWRCATPAYVTLPACTPAPSTGGA